MTNLIQSFVHDPHTNISTEETFSSKSEAHVSDLLENIEEMFPCYYKRSVLFGVFKSPGTYYCVIPA